MSSITPLWLDCDPGHDDAFALLLAAHHPSLHLLGVSTVHGNASLAKTTANARSVLVALGRPEVAVHAGAAKPFCRFAVHAPDIHGESGLDGTDLLPKPPATAPLGGAVLAMRDALMAQPAGKAWVVATGALTNVGLLFSAFPEVAAHVAGLSIMGGALGGGFTDAPLGSVGAKVRIGNTTPWAEFNIYCDPEAAQALLSNHALAAKTVLVPLDVTHKVLATEAVRGRILGGGEQGPSALRRMMHELLVFFAATYERVFGIGAGPPLHDPLAVAAVLQGARLDYGSGERWGVAVELEGRHVEADVDGGRGTVDIPGSGNQVGRTVATKLAGGDGGVRIPRGVDLEWFWGEILGALARADEHVAKQG